MDLDKITKVPSEIVKGGSEAIKDLPKKAVGFKEPAKIAVTALAGIPVEMGLDYLSNMLLNAIGAEDNLLLKMGVKIGVPIGLSALFIGAKLPAGQLVVVASVVSIVITIGRLIVSKLGLFPSKDTNSATKKYDANVMNTVPAATNWDNLIK